MSTRERKLMARLKQTASRTEMNGNPFFMCLVLIGYEANIGSSPDVNPKVTSFPIP
jgi:hypothetical protein